MMERGFEGSEDRGVVFFEERFGVAAEVDEVGSDMLYFGAELGDIDGVGWDAGMDELCEEGVDFFGGIKVLEVRDFVVQFADFLDQRIFEANHVDIWQ